MSPPMRKLPLQQWMKVPNPNQVMKNQIQKKTLETLVLDFELKSHKRLLFIWQSIIINALRMANAFDILSRQFTQLYQEIFFFRPPLYVHIIHTNVRHEVHWHVTFLINVGDFEIILFGNHDVALLNQMLDGPIGIICFTHT